jgi:hypothetical protein
MRLQGDGELLGAQGEDAAIESSPQSNGSAEILLPASVPQTASPPSLPKISLQSTLTEPEHSIAAPSTLNATMEFEITPLIVFDIVSPATRAALFRMRVQASIEGLPPAK